MRSAARVTLALFAFHPLFATAAGAQAEVGCSKMGTGLGTAGGAVLGAWVGFVVAKAKLSDWNDASHSASAIGQRNRITIGGAVGGGVLANLLFRGSCRSRLGFSAAPNARSGAHRPITAEEIQKSGITGTVFDLVYALRRPWLNARGQGMSDGPRIVNSDNRGDAVVGGEPKIIVYLDESRLGAIAQLQSIPLAGVVGVRYFTASEATFKWGTGHPSGAIQVVSVSQRAGDVRPRPIQMVPAPSLP